MLIIILSNNEQLPVLLMISNLDVVFRLDGTEI